MILSLKYFLHDESGQDLIEYAIAAALIGIGAITGLKSLQTAIGTAFTKIATTLTTSV